MNHSGIIKHMGNEKKEYVQPELLPGTRIPSTKKEQPAKKKRKAHRTFQEAVDLVRLKRDRIYNQPATAENLDGQIVDLTGRASDDDRPVKPLAGDLKPVPANVPSNVRALSRMIEKGTLGKKKQKKIPESTDFTHSKVNKKVGGATITGYAYDATLPQLGEQANKENLHKMAEIVQKILKKPGSAS